MTYEAHFLGYLYDLSICLSSEEQCRGCYNFGVLGVEMIFSMLAFS
jgi:hypothetical protein